MLTYKNTIVSCFVGYIVQAIVNNFIPLLCRMCGWEPIDCADVVPDITYDRDTGRLLRHNL